MKLVQALGPFSYEVIGADEASESAAADYLDQALNLLSRTSQNFDLDWADAQQSCKNKFDVLIRIHE